MLAELEANPTDRFMRLVYADWLDEQGKHHDADFQRYLTTIDGLNAVLDMQPDDWLARRCLAARLCETHREEEAACQIWMVNNERCPAMPNQSVRGYYSNERWNWFPEFFEDGTRTPFPHIYSLPRNIWAFIAYELSKDNSATRVMAESDLCQALVATKSISRRAS